MTAMKETTTEERLAHTEDRLAHTEEQLRLSKESNDALERLIKRERERSETLVAMVRRAAKEVAPKSAGKDLLVDLEKLLRP